MDQQQNCDSIPCPRAPCRIPSAGHRRRRRTLALAAAAVLASAPSASATAAAFAPSPGATPPECRANRRSPFVGGDSSQRRSTERSSPRRERSLRVPSMVSFLEAPTATMAMPPRKKERSPGRSSGRIRKGLAKESRTVEIDMLPDYNFLGLGLDDLAVSSPSRSRHPPAIDSEILFEGITSAPPKQQGSGTTYNAAAAAQSTQNKSTANKKSKSSTMPGFAKDDDLDAHIVQLGLSRLPATRSPARRGAARAVRSDAARLRRRAANSETLYRRSPSVPDSLLDYAQEIHAVERVTPKEEKELGARTQEAIRLQGLHEELQARYRRDPTDDEWCAAAGKVNVVALQEAIRDGMRAKNQLVASNLRLVQRVINLYIRNGLGSEYNAGDLMQDGTMALIRAAEKFEPDRGFRFSTYAMYWIRSAVKRSQTSQSRIVAVPQRIHETHKRLAKCEARLREELGGNREPAKEELAAACDITVTQLDRCRKAMRQVTFSLDAEVHNHHKPNSPGSRKDTMYDIVEGRVDETEYERTQRLLMKDHLIGTLRKFLTPHEVDLLLLRYGLMDERALPRGMSGPLTIAQVSNLVGLKPDKVRRMIINSQKQLKHLMTEWEDFEYELA